MTTIWRKRCLELFNRYGYTGHEKDSDTNLIYYRARWHDAEEGRFISQDPIGFGK